MAATDRLMTPAEFCSFAGIAAQTAANWRSQRKGPQFVLIGGRPRYRMRDVERWLDAQTVRTY